MAIFPPMKKFKFLGVLIVLALIAAVVYYFTGTYSDGFRAGTVVKLSRKGYIFKTYEGQLNLGMVINQDPNSPASVNNVWDFSVSSKSKGVIDSLENALTTGQRVRLHYKEKYKKLPWMGETPYFIYKVEIAPR
jgi:hypothetical protein